MTEAVLRNKQMWTLTVWIITDLFKMVSNIQFIIVQDRWPLLSSGVNLRKAMRSGGQIPPNNLPDPLFDIMVWPTSKISPWRSGNQRSEASVNNTMNVRRKPVITTSRWHWEPKHLLTILREMGGADKGRGRQEGEKNKSETGRKEERKMQEDRQTEGEKGIRKTIWQVKKKKKEWERDRQTS